MTFDSSLAVILNITLDQNRPNVFIKLHAKVIVHATLFFIYNFTILMLFSTCMMDFLYTNGDSQAVIFNRLPS